MLVVLGQSPTGAHKSVTAAAPRPCLPVKAKAVVSPQSTALAAAAANWRLQIMAHQLARWDAPASLFMRFGVIANDKQRAITLCVG